MMGRVFETYSKWLPPVSMSLDVILGTRVTEAFGYSVDVT